MKTTIKTVVKNWSLVTIKDELSPFQILWGIVERGNYVCSSRILYIEDNLVKTHTGSSYKLVGEGSKYTASYTQLISLIDGLSPDDLKLEKK